MITHRADSDWERFSCHDNTMSSFKSEDTSKTLCLLDIDFPLFSLYVTSVEYSNMYSMCMLPMSLSVFVLKSSLFSPHFLFIYCYFHSDFPLHYHLFPILSISQSLYNPPTRPPSAMQEDALKLVLLALEDGSALSRKVLVLFVVQKLEARFPQASKTSIGHVVQLLYRASCFKVQAVDVCTLTGMCKHAAMTGSTFQWTEQANHRSLNLFYVKRYKTITVWCCPKNPSHDKWPH